MPKKADILPEHTTADCRQCGEYDNCDNCNRRMCSYVAVRIYEHGEGNELWCRPCVREHGGWAEREIATQAVDFATGLSGEAIYDAAEKEKG